MSLTTCLISVAIYFHRDILLPSFSTYYPYLKSKYDTVTDFVGGPTRPLYITSYVDTDNPRIKNHRKIKELFKARSIPIVSPDELDWKDRVDLFNGFNLCIVDPGSCIYNSILPDISFCRTIALLPALQFAKGQEHMISHYLEFFFMKNHFSFILGDPIKAGNHHLDIISQISLPNSSLTIPHHYSLEDIERTLDV